MDFRTEVAEENQAGILYKIDPVLCPGKPSFIHKLANNRDEAQRRVVKLFTTLQAPTDKINNQSTLHLPKTGVYS